MEEKPELQKVLEQRNRIQALKQQKKQHVEKSPLEQQLLKRQMRLEKVNHDVTTSIFISRCLIYITVFELC